MRSLSFGGLILSVACLALPLQAAPAKIIKVLPHFLDQQGRHLLHPSLYERDAYQDHLRKNPAERSGLRFDVQWKAAKGVSLKLRVEMRGVSGNDSTSTQVEAVVQRRGRFSEWSSATLRGDEHKKFGELVAWRATLWEGDKLVAEQKSFLW